MAEQKNDGGTFTATRECFRQGTAEEPGEGRVRAGGQFRIARGEKVPSWAEPVDAGAKDQVSVQGKKSFQERPVGGR